MKKLLGLTAPLILAGSVLAQTFTAPATPHGQIVQPKPPPPITARDIGGVIPRAVRGGNPAQMLNPRAPAKYGTAEQSVMMRPDGKWNGIKLFTIYF